MTTTDPATAVTTQVHRVYIRATPEAIWDAITKPEWTARYGYGGRADYDLRPGGAYRHHASEEMLAGGSPEIAVDGEVVEADPPRRLVQTWRMLMDPDMKAEGFTRLTHEIQPIEGGATKLTIIHELEGAPRLAADRGRRVGEPGRGRRLGVDPQRPQVAAGDRQAARGLRRARRRRLLRREGLRRRPAGDAHHAVRRDPRRQRREAVPREHAGAAPRRTPRPRRAAAAG